MGHTLSVRLTKKLAAWLENAAQRTGMSQGQIVRDQLERACENAERPFMRLAGSVRGPRDLSARKGFSKP
jgi:predicted DNA-binding protein